MRRFHLFLLLVLAIAPPIAQSAPISDTYSKADAQIGRSVGIDGEQGMLRFYEEYYRAALSPRGEEVHTAKMTIRPPVSEISDPTEVAENLAPRISEFAARSMSDIPTVTG